MARYIRAIQQPRVCAAERCARDHLDGPHSGGP